MQNSDGYDYWAFISYSRHDAKYARKLLRELERFGIPARLRPNADDLGGLSRTRLRPIFLDREELAASADLGASLRGRLEKSRFLIVVSSPNSARSEWVNQEVIDFKLMGRASRILAAIIDGEPNASDPTNQCYPPALRFQVDRDGGVTDITAPTPRGANFQKDGWRDAFLQIVAGMLEVGLDDLKRRHRARRTQTFASGVGALCALAVGVYSAIQVGTRGRIDAAVEVATSDISARADRDRFAAAALERMNTDDGSYMVDRMPAVALALQASPPRGDTNEYLPAPAEWVLRASGISILPQRIIVLPASSPASVSAPTEDGYYTAPAAPTVTLSRFAGPIPVVDASSPTSCADAARLTHWFQRVTPCLVSSQAHRLECLNTRCNSYPEQDVAGLPGVRLYSTSLAGYRSPSEPASLDRADSAEFHIPNGCSWYAPILNRRWLLCGEERDVWFLDPSGPRGTRSLRASFSHGYLSEQELNFFAAFEEGRRLLYVKGDSETLLVFDVDDLEPMNSDELPGTVCGNAHALEAGGVTQLWPSWSGINQSLLAPLLRQCEELGYVR